MEVRCDHEHFCVASHGCFVVVVWGREVEADDLERLSEVQRAAVAACEHCAVLSIIRAGLTMAVNDDVREASQRNLREFTDVTLGSAMVVEAGGMRASFFRSVITGIHLVTRSKVPQKVFDNIDEAVRWLLSQPGLDPTTASSVDDILAGVQQLADQYGQPNASA